MTYTMPDKLWAEDREHEDDMGYWSDDPYNKHFVTHPYIKASLVAQVLADEIERAAKAHKEAYPQDDYKHHNETLGALRRIALRVDPTTMMLSNEDTIAKLRQWQ